nr:alcohol dehydrogenase catalytic domain-containing protein [Propionicimonas sp.]
MRAMVFRPGGERLEEVPEPRPRVDEVLLRVEFCGICGSDLHAGEPDFHPGTVMGHEFSATVQEVGSQVEHVGPGDRVVVNPNGGWCGTCRECVQGRVNLCPSIWATSIGLARDGGLAPYVAVPERFVHRLPDEFSLKTAALVEPMGVALRTVRNSGIMVGDNAVVFGAGPIGLLVTTILAAAGANQIVVVEPNPMRRHIALGQGATDALDPKVTPLEGYFEDKGRPKYAFECSGSPDLVGVGLKVLGPRGTLSVTGFSRRPPQFDSAELLFKELQIRGSFIYTSEFPEAIAFLARGKVDFSALITGIVSVENAHEAFSAMRTSPDVVKYLVSDFNQG